MPSTAKQKSPFKRVQRLRQRQLLASLLNAILKPLHAARHHRMSDGAEAADSGIMLDLQVVRQSSKVANA